jgi:excisionase family DNA binding protein
MRSGGEEVAPVDRLLTVEQAAEYLGTTVRFPRRLIAERRIRFVKLGTHVRIPESAVLSFIEASTVEPFDGARVARVVVR